MDVAQLVKDAVAVYELAGREMSLAVRFKRVSADLTVALIDERALVDTVESQWGSITAAAFANSSKFDDLVAKLERSREPAFLSVGLLDMLGRARRETLHTRTIGALVDPARADALGRDLLKALVRLVLAQAGGNLPADSDIEKARVCIEPRYYVAGRRGRGGQARYPMPDLRIEIDDGQRASGKLVIIVENKIDDIDREGQLGTYAACARESHADPVLVFLTPNGSPPSQTGAGDWILLSYGQLAVAWRAELQKVDGSTHNAWREILRAYLTTIVREIHKVRLAKPSGLADKSRAFDYLLAATGA